MKSNRNEVLREIWQKWCELDYMQFDIWLHKEMQGSEGNMFSEIPDEIVVGIAGSRVKKSDSDGDGIGGYWDGEKWIKTPAKPPRA